MKHLIVSFGGQEELAERSPEWIQRMIEQMTVIDEELTESGELLVEQGLADPSTARTVTVDRGSPVTTDGPFAASRESIAGFWIVDVTSEQRAVEIAARISAAVAASIEVRQCADAPEG